MKFSSYIFDIDWHSSGASNEKTPSDSSSSGDDSNSSTYHPSPLHRLGYPYSFSGDNSPQADVVTLNDDNATSVNEKVIIGCSINFIFCLVGLFKIPFFYSFRIFVA